MATKRLARCGRGRGRRGPGGLEFPAVLLNTSTGVIESEFHMYVQPQEHPILSEFCTELTGITQNQVDEGVPLNICLSQFLKWIQKIQKEKKIIFITDSQSNSTSEAKACAFVTWTDWDLGVCLHYECRRKQLRKPDILNSWIDLKATYRVRRLADSNISTHTVPSKADKAMLCVPVARVTCSLSMVVVLNYQLPQNRVNLDKNINARKRLVFDKRMIILGEFMSCSSFPDTFCSPCFLAFFCFVCSYCCLTLLCRTLSSQSI
uniref:ERI1 exoribonuclease family member 2 n=1 Tax=Malurus cyaneus samueli TaxID=2593467 RepID=A0A8C5UFQ1_9PASS